MARGHSNPPDLRSKGIVHNSQSCSSGNFSQRRTQSPELSKEHLSSEDEEFILDTQITLTLGLHPIHQENYFFLSLRTSLLRRLQATFRNAYPIQRVSLDTLTWGRKEWKIGCQELNLFQLVLFAATRCHSSPTRSFSCFRFFFFKRIEEGKN